MKEPVADAMPLSRMDVRRGLRISIWEGIWATVFSVLTTGAFQIGFALYLGATPFVLGLLAAIPPLVGLLQLPASLYRGERKRFVGYPAVTARLMWVPILFIPFVLPRSLWVGAFLVLLTLSSALLSIVVPGWTSWMSDMVPPGERGQYFARRNTLAGIVALVVPLPAGAFLDQAVKYNRFDPRIGFGVLFGLSAVATLISFYLILRQPEPPIAKNREPATNPLRSLTAPLADVNFRSFLIFSSMVVASQNFAGQFFTAWQVDKAALNLPYLTFQILGIVGAGATLGATPIWGYLADKYGSRPILNLCTAGVIIAPFLWIFTLPHATALNIVLIVLINFLAGAFWAGVGLTQFNLLLGLAPDSSRATYVAVFSAATGIFGGIAPLIGGALMGILASVHLPVGNLMTLNNYKMLFLITVLMRFASLAMLRGVREADGPGRSTRYVLGQLRQARPVTSFRTLRRLSHPSDEQDRQAAVDTLGELRSPLAVEELTHALDDVSPSVREGAARALGGIADKRALPALIAKLSDPAAGIGDLAADALGAIGDPSASDALMAVVTGPDARVRVAALRALARIADPKIAMDLIPLLNPSHPTTCESACAVCAAIAPKLMDGDESVAESISECLITMLGNENPRGIRLAAARALEPLVASRVCSPLIFETLAARLREETDDAVAAQEAGGLARLGLSQGIAPGHLLEIIVPVLDLPDLDGIAYKQAIDAVALIGLPNGEFYPYLTLRESASEESIQRLLTDIRRKLHDEAAAIALGAIQESLTNGELDRTLYHLAQLAHRTVNTENTENAAYQILEVIARRAIQNQYARPTEVLLAVVLLHRLIEGMTTTGGTPIFSLLPRR